MEPLIRRRISNNPPPYARLLFACCVPPRGPAAALHRRGPAAPLSLITCRPTPASSSPNSPDCRCSGPSGESIGKVRGHVVALRLDRKPPSVLGLVVDLPTAGRSSSRCSGSALESQAVALTTGSVSLRRFEQRTLELRLIGQLIGVQVRLATTAVRRSSSTSAIEKTRSRDWLVSRLAVRERTRRIVRRAPVQVVGWTDVRGMDPADLTGHSVRGAPQVLASFEGLRAADAAGILRDLDPALRYEVADAMDDDRLADVIAGTARRRPEGTAGPPGRGTCRGHPRGDGP